MKTYQMREWQPAGARHGRSYWLKYKLISGGLRWAMYGKRKNGEVIYVYEDLPALAAADLAAGVMSRRLVALRLRKARRMFWRMMSAPR